MRIGKTEYRHGLFLAPMANVTDHPFRSICVSYGAEGVCTELISSKAVCHGDRKTDLLARLYEDERPAAVQLFGHEPEVMAEAAARIQELSPAYIDLNFGCPMPKLVCNGDGCALMLQPDLCGRIVRAVSDRVSCPVTVKIRKGWSETEANAVLVATVCEQNGASAVFVHGRTKDQLYSGKADREIIAEVKKAVSIPVIGNGDVDSPESAKDMFERTGCDGIMIGRGAYGRPWLFRDLRNAMENGWADACMKPEPPDAGEIRAVVRRQIRALEEEKGTRALVEMRKHLTKYCRDLPGSAKMRERINSASTRKELEDIADLLFPDGTD
ncbi:MAG: tRNA dihydrouridine synthase DusB [Clostridia bacterium]|nr:tRNA dihydrouridine synthase DusB [Clostridia bacterium]